MGNRKAFTDYVVQQVSKIHSGNKTAERLKAKLESLSDKEFELMVQSILDETFYLPYYISNSEKGKIDITRLVNLSRSIGFDPFNVLEVEDPKTGDVYLTEVLYWVGMFPGRRQTQYLISKRSAAKDSKSRDVFTGQVAGDSKSSALSAPQLAGMLGRGCTNNALELAKFRGGDIQAGRAFMSMLINGGGVSMEPIVKAGTHATVNSTVGSYLNAAHLQHNLKQLK